MALWGEGDPRWVVQNRDDGKNVNGWHWEERNKLEWSRSRLGELCAGLDLGLDPGVGCATVTLLKDLTGEAAITTRKGNKRFAVFDLKLTLAWEGSAAEQPDKQVRGEVVVEEVHSTGDEDDYVYRVTVEGAADAPGAAALRAGVEGAGARTLVYSCIAQFVKDIHALE